VLPSSLGCLRSIFGLHSETINIWTHLIAAVVSVLFSIHYVLCEADDWIHKLTITMQLLGIAFCMGASATYHVFFCHSETVCKFLAKCDYCGIIVHIATGYTPYLYSLFHCWPTVALSYIALLNSVGAITVFVIIQDRFRGPRYAWLRVSLLCALTSIGIIPAIHYWLIESYDKFMSLYVNQLTVIWICNVTGGVAYATRFPERFFPGKCDIMWQSHQILHVCTALGVMLIFTGAKNMAAMRLEHGANCLPTETSNLSLVVDSVLNSTFEQSLNLPSLFEYISTLM